MQSLLKRINSLTPKAKKMFKDVTSNLMAGINHGHEMMLRYREQISLLVKASPYEHVIIEMASAWENGSTTRLAKMAKSIGTNFISVSS